MHAFMIHVLKDLPFVIPYFVLMVVGIWIGVRHRNRNPKASRLFILAFALLGGVAILRSLNRAWLGMVGDQHGSTFIDRVLTFAVTSTILDLAFFAAWVILLLGVHRSFQSETTGQ